MTNQQCLKIGLVVILVLAVGAVVYVSLVKTPEPIVQQPSLVQTQPNTPPIPTPIPKEETTSNTTYSNTKYHYSFTYPKSFTIYTGTDQEKEEVIPPTPISEKVSLTDKKAMLFCCEATVTSVSVIKGTADIKNWRQYGDIPDYRIQSQGDIMFNGHKAFEVRGSLGIDSAGTRLIIIPGKEYSYILIQGNEGEKWDAITNSFTFDDTNLPL